MVPMVRLSYGGLLGTYLSSRKKLSINYIVCVLYGMYQLVGCNSLTKPATTIHQSLKKKYKKDKNSTKSNLSWRCTNAALVCEKAHNYRLFCTVIVRGYSTCFNGDL